MSNGQMGRSVRNGLTRRDTSFLRPISPSTPSIRLLALATSFSTCGGQPKCAGRSRGRRASRN